MYGVGFMPNKFVEPETIYSRLFLASSWDEMAAARRTWLKEDIPERFWGSKPIQFLMGSLKEQVRRSVPGDDNPQPMKLKHESFLAVLDEALAMEGWPEKDRLRNVLERLNNRVDGEGAVPGVKARSRSWPPPMRHIEPANVFDMPSSSPAPRERPRGSEAPRHKDVESSPASAHKRVQAADGEEERRSKKRRRIEAPRRSDVAPPSPPIEIRAIPSSIASAPNVSLKQRASNQMAHRQVIEGRSRLPSRALFSKVMRSRCCGFWRHLLRR